MSLMLWPVRPEKHSPYPRFRKTPVKGRACRSRHCRYQQRDCGLSRRPVLTDRSTMCPCPTVTRTIVLSQLSCRTYAKGQPSHTSAINLHRGQSSRNGLSNASNRAHILDPHCHANSRSRQWHRSHYRCAGCGLVIVSRIPRSDWQQSDRDEPSDHGQR